MRILDLALYGLAFLATAYIVLQCIGPAPDSATWSTVLMLESQDLFQDSSGGASPARLRVECDGERAEVFVNGIVVGGRDETLRVLRGDQVRLGGATFRGEGPDLEQAREACGLDASPP